MNWFTRALGAIALLSIVSCAASPPDKVRRLDELPPRYRELWTAFRRADPDWPQMRSEVQADPELERFVVRLEGDEG